MANRYRNRKRRNEEGCEDDRCRPLTSIPTGNLLDFFRWIPVNFLWLSTGTGRKSSEKIRRFSGGNTASTFRRFSVLSCRNRPVIFDLGSFLCRLFVYHQQLIFRISVYLTSFFFDHVVVDSLTSIAKQDLIIIIKDSLYSYFLV